MGLASKVVLREVVGMRRWGRGLFQKSVWYCRLVGGLKRSLKQESWFGCGSPRGVVQVVGLEPLLWGQVLQSV